MAILTVGIDIAKNVFALHGLADGLRIGPLQGAPSQRLGPSTGTNSPQDYLCPGSASFLPRLPLMR